MLAIVLQIGFRGAGVWQFDEILWALPKFIHLPDLLNSRDNHLFPFRWILRRIHGGFTFPLFLLTLGLLAGLFVGDSSFFLKNGYYLLFLLLQGLSLISVGFVLCDFALCGGQLGACMCVCVRAYVCWCLTSS